MTFHLQSAFTPERKNLEQVNLQHTQIAKCTFKINCTVFYVYHLQAEWNSTESLPLLKNTEQLSKKHVSKESLPICHYPLFQEFVHCKQLKRDPASRLCTPLKDKALHLPILYFLTATNRRYKNKILSGYLIGLQLYMALGKPSTMLC